MLNYILMLIKISAVVGVTILRRSQHPRLSKCPPRVASAVSRIISGTEFIIPPPPRCLLLRQPSNVAFPDRIAPSPIPTPFGWLYVQPAFDHKRVGRSPFLLLAVNPGWVVYVQLSSFCLRNIKPKFHENAQSNQSCNVMMAKSKRRIFRQ